MTSYLFLNQSRAVTLLLVIAPRTSVEIGTAATRLSQSFLKDEGTYVKKLAGPTGFTTISRRPPHARKRPALVAAYTNVGIP